MRGRQMYVEEVKRVHRVSTRKDKFRERERYRRSFWGTVFLELVLEKMSEEEFDFENEEEKQQETKRPVKRRPTPAPQPKRVSFQLEKGTGKRKFHWELPKRKEESFLECERVLFWASGDFLEIAARPERFLEHSENYGELVSFMRQIGVVATNQLFLESNEILRKYYDGAVEKFYVERAFYRYCREKIKGKEDSPFFIYDTLTETYEYFLHANVQNAVRCNNEEGKHFAMQSGISWAGSSYYHAKYYYKALEMEELFEKICTELAEEYDTDVPDFAVLKEENQFQMDGGLTFHGAWVWAQSQNNYPAAEYGLRVMEAKPPEGFLYFYRDYFNNGQYRTFEILKMKICEMLAQNPADEREFYTFTVEEKEYHNGLSYLLEQKISKENWEFLANFRLHRTAGCMEILCG